MEELLKYFPELTETQIEQFKVLGLIYPEWNAKINVISRKDIDNLYVHHILHSLGIAKFFTPVSSTKFLDFGTGGGFPGIPLAIMFPDCSFHLIDRIGKKLKVAEAAASAAGLTNVTVQHGDIGECHGKYDFVVSRAVMRLEDLAKLSRKNISSGSSNSLPNGLLCLKGGDLREEISATCRPTIEVPLSDYFSDEYFETKKLLYVEM